MKNGDVVYFKKAKTSTHRKAVEVGFKGYGFGVLLGHTPPFAKDPPPEHLIRLMGTIGFVTFDDVAAFLGDEFGQKCVKAFEDKYYGKVMPETLVPEVAPAPSVIVGANGEPILSPAEAAEPEPTHDA